MVIFLINMVQIISLNNLCSKTQLSGNITNNES